ncbi:MAG: class I SAM-dependent methyltransferase [Thermoguttaceae bacterium]
MSVQNDGIWDGAYKIPWDDPDFSRRMLREHLSQDHDMASRRTEWIDKQVAWIHEDLLGGKPSSILDLGCGPGFYSHRLAAQGHRCHGIDFGPASIGYAQQHNPGHSQCTFILGDIRHAPFGGPYDLAMILFGEFNVFAPAEALAILQKVRASLRPEGRLILETQTYEAVEQAGQIATSEQRCESGLFSDQPYHCRTESRWSPNEEATVQTFFVTETANSQTQIYRSTTRAWSDNDLMALLMEARFSEAASYGQWPCNTDALKLWAAKKI